MPLKLCCLVVIVLSLYCGIHMLQLSLAKLSEDQAHNNPKHVNGITQVSVLPENFRPSKTQNHGKRRLLFIGDVHGTYDELVHLLEKVKYKSSTGIDPFGDHDLRSRSHYISGGFSIEGTIFT